MRIVRAGESPSAEAAAMSEVVLKGAGGATVRFFFSMDVTTAEVLPSMWAMTACASDSTLKRAVSWGASNASSPSPNAPLMTQ